MTNTDTFQLDKLKLPSRFAEKLEADLKYILDTNIESLNRIILFGSCARGDYRLTSDIDLLILTEDPIERILHADISSELEEPRDFVKTDTLFLTVEEYEHSNRLIADKIKKEGVLLYVK